jgi:hypothetical protein
VKIVVATVLLGVVAFFFKDELFTVILAPKYDDFVIIVCSSLLQPFFCADGWLGFSGFSHQYGVGSAIYRSCEDGYVLRFSASLAVCLVSVVQIRFSSSLF